MKLMRSFVIQFLVFVFLVAFVVANARGEMMSWGVERIGARSLWDKDWNMVVDVGANAGDSVRVAIINTGIDRSHPDLQDNIVGGAYVYYDPSSPGGASLIEADYDDTDGHGTKVAGVVCAVDKDPGAVGAAPHSGIFAIKLESSFFLHPEVDARAIRYAADKSNINVIVLPYTFPAQDDLAHLIESACNYAYSQGKLVVASSGNVHPALNEVYYPANVSCVVAVGATDKNDERWTDSNYGPELDFVAPGVDINLTNLGGGYVVESGTSYSAPYVAAAAALVFATYPGEDNQFVWRTLNSTVHDLGAAGWDEEFGMGLVNAYWPCQLPPGDVNGDHKVDIFDATLIAKHFGSVYPEASYYAVADINIDRVIDIFDIVQVALYFGQVYNP